MFDNIAGIDNVKSVSRATVSNQIDTLMDLAQNRIGQRDGLQQWINKNIKSLPAICTDRFITIIRDYDKVQQDLSDTLWLVCMLSIQQQGYTSVALLSAVTKTSLNESTGMESTNDTWKESSVWMLNTLVKLGMVADKLVDMEGTDRKQRLFYIDANWSKVHLNPIIEELRTKAHIVCKPLEFCPPNWMEGNTEQDRTKLQLVSNKANTKVNYRASKETLEPLNLLQRVGFEVANGCEDNIFDCLDNEQDEQKREAFNELLELQGKRFFFPVSADYRFRMYYRGGIVHPQAQKEVRQFLNFSEGETVNRVKAIRDLTLALADRENPVQRKELDRLETLTSEFITSKVMIHKDGTANGLQHQSVMLRSRKLAGLTKLLKDVLTEEVYLHVANVITMNGIKVSRKFIKVIIMVASYGATKNTLLEKLREELDTQDALKAYTIMNRELPELKQYTNFISSRCKRIKTDTCEMNTPDGFQLKFKKIDRTESTLYAGKFSAIVGTTYIDDPDATARSAAPNLIHMTDSYHLRMVVTGWTGNIATIHDSVGVTCGRGEELQELILDKFVECHKHNWLSSWTDANEVAPLNKVGDLKLSEINNPDMFC